MKLTVYKGFNSEFLRSLDAQPLVKSDVEQKKNVLSFDRNTRKQLRMALINLEEEADEVWVTYEEYSLIKKQVDDSISEDGLKLMMFRNNLYPDYYPVEFPVSEVLAAEIHAIINGETSKETSEECQQYLAVYSSLIKCEDSFYGSFYNYEYDQGGNITLRDFYPYNLIVEDSQETSEYDIFINEDIESYLKEFTRMKTIGPKVIGINSIVGEIAKRIQKSLQAYCLLHNIRVIKYHEKLSENLALEEELISIAQNDIKIEGFSSFRSIKFYQNPDIDNQVMDLSQAQIIQEIIYQAEASYDSASGRSFRDIFITASTGAGKSVMFQIPAVYLAKKYHKLTIIIEPVKALMQDQKEKLNNNGFMRVETFNSDLITQIEKEEVLKRIREGQVDLLYLSPETLLSYSIETIIGDREIGLLIVDEAHIVTTWGIGFRPDYWYLGAYINRLRNQIQTNRDNQRKTYHFPICAFTATAVNGGIDDSVSDTIISLYMENPIKYIGYVRRDDIKFEIVHNHVDKKLPKAEYEVAKTRALDKRLKQWLDKNEKTIVYFPYASYVKDASAGMRGFAGITTDKRIGTYTGRNINELSNEAFNEVKRHTFEGFRNGTIPVMMATKAFGMGVDVNDVQNIYHYAVTGNLCDYVQEIGRAARDKGMDGTAITDHIFNDFTFMKVLFGMSQIRQYQIKKVLEGIYDTYKSKHEARSFLISPESFTYIFNGRDESDSINKLKTCLLMLEKDFYEKYNFQVLIARPQSVFTKAFVCINREKEDLVLNSKYGRCMKFVEKGRFQERQIDNSLLSDTGDIYTIDLKQIWEDFHPNISFPQFKYWYFKANAQSKNKVDIMPSIRNYFQPRQKLTLEARGDLLLSELRDKILDDFEFIANHLYSEYRKQFFTIDDFTKLIQEKYGKTKARIIANSLFDLVDSEGRCVKRRNNDSSGKATYALANGNFKEYMRRPIIKSRIISSISRVPDASSYVGYMNLAADEKSNIALKLLSIFEYITYEVAGGEEPEIFIRLNDPNKIKSIVFGNMVYSNNYVKQAKQKHDRDVDILRKFFNELHTDEERWNYIEEYFLGNDVLSGGY